MNTRYSYCTWCGTVSVDLGKISWIATAVGEQRILRHVPCQSHVFASPAYLTLVFPRGAQDALMQNKEATKRFDARMSELSDFVEMQVRTPQGNDTYLVPTLVVLSLQGRTAEKLYSYVRVW